MNRAAKRISAWGLALAMLLLCTGCIFAPEYIEVTADEAIFAERFYYEQLSEEDQLIYREIYQGITEQKAEFIVHSTTGEKANDILTEVLLDSPELFWTEGHVTSTAYYDIYTVVEPVYNCTTEEKAKKQTQIETATAEILGSVPANLGEYDKIKYIYEYLVNSIEYVEDAPDNQNMYSALVGKSTVCAGYAKANQYLLRKLGLECIYVTGKASGEEKMQEHAWNIVKCNGKYYYEDVTWADPLFAPTEEPVVGSNQMIYDYLCCDENALSATHTIAEGYEYPICNSDDLNYYRMNGMFYETADKKVLRDAMYQSINAKSACTIFKFASSDVYNQAKDLIMEQLLDDAIQYLGRRYGLWEVTCYYHEDAKLNKFIVDWIYQ